MSDAGQKSVKFREAVFFVPALDRRKTYARRTLKLCWKHWQEIWNPRWKRVESARDRGRSALDARHLRVIRGRNTRRYEAQRRRGTTPLSTRCSRARDRRREVDAMTVLALIAAILEFASSLLGFLTAIMERLPIRKDKEP